MRFVGDMERAVGGVRDRDDGSDGGVDDNDNDSDVGCRAAASEPAMMALARPSTLFVVVVVVVDFVVITDAADGCRRGGGA